MIDKYQTLTRGTGRRWNTVSHLRRYMSNDGWAVTFEELAEYLDRRPAGMPRDILLDEIVEDREKISRQERKNRVA